MAQSLQSCDLSLTRSHSNYLAQVSINISKAQSDSNDIVLRMTLVASILVPLNIVTGLWGMNVRVPGENGEDLMWFFGILGMMVILAWMTYRFVLNASI